MNRSVRLLAFTIGLLATTSALAADGTITGTVAGTPRLRRDAVVYLVGAPATAPVAGATADFDQKNMVFVPRVLPIVSGTSVRFLNSDAVRHNVFTPDGEKYNLGTWPQGEVKTYPFDKCKTKLCVYTQLCNVHTEMEGFIVVLQNKHFALVKPDGTFTITGAPAGTWTVELWSPKLPKASAVPSAKITVTPGVTTTATLTVGG
jgi:plastocyanin